MAKIEEKVEELITNTIQNLGYELYDVEYVKEARDYYLRVYIDNEKGITLDDCELVSNNITDLLDKEDYIKEQYFLEVSSPGVERVLRRDKHLEGNIGKNVQIKLFKPLNGKKQYVGTLKKYNEDINIPRQDIAQTKTIFEW